MHRGFIVTVHKLLTAELITIKIIISQCIFPRDSPFCGFLLFYVSGVPGATE